MGGYGSGRSGGRPTVEIESALRLDIDSMMCWGAIRPGFHLVGGTRLHQFYGSRRNAAASILWRRYRCEIRVACG
jgi:hypothetical protein